MYILTCVRATYTADYRIRVREPVGICTGSIGGSVISFILVIHSKTYLGRDLSKRFPLFCKLWPESQIR